MISSFSDSSLTLKLLVSAEYFGGSLNFRSLDGHGMDVYYRVSKMGKTREGVEDVGED